METSALIKSARAGDLAKLQDLVRQCTTDLDLGESLLWAALGGHLQVVRFLVEQCAVDVASTTEDGVTALMWAASSGEVAIIRYLAEHGGDVNTRSKNGYTALAVAAQYGYIEVVRYLTEQCDVDVRATNENGSSALLLAAANGHIESARYLVEQCGLNVNTQNKNGYTALMGATHKNHLEMVRYLAEQGGADVNVKNENGDTALLLAVQNDRIEIVRYLAELRGGDISAQNQDGCTALMLAAQGGKLELVGYLVELSGTREDRDEALKWSATSGDVEIVKHLVEHCGADVMSEDGARAIIFAASKGDIETVRYLVEQCGADVDAKDKFGGSTALMWAADNGMIKVVRYLVERGGADVNVRSKTGATAFMRAAGKGNIQIVRYLFEHCGADVNVKANSGDTALLWAAEDGRVEVVRYLAEQCEVDVNVKNGKGDTAVMLAAGNDKIQVVRYLTAQCGADVNIYNAEGDTALMKAAVKGSTEVVQCLAEQCGADVNSKNGKGDTALISAVEYEHLEVAQYLAEQCGADVNARNEGENTVLMWASKHGYLELVRYLAEECGAHVNAKNGEGETVLMWAAKSGKVQVVQYLVEQCNAHVNARRNDGCTALRLAADHGYQEIQRILTPFLLPAPLQDTIDTTGIADRVAPSSHRLACGIPPSEIELSHFSRNGNIGGEFQGKWLDADVVVKLFLPDASHSSFEDEILLWQRLRHPNVVKMYGACEASSYLHFFVCEYASHGSLLEQVDASSAGKPTTWKYLHGAALGLEYLHERGIVHGDLRCSNILIGADSVAKLSNFALSDSMKNPTSSTSPLIGSSRWQAPEVLRGEMSSKESDVYSLGLSILEAVTGMIPWGGGDDSAQYWPAQFNKKHWTPETEVDSWYAPNCPAGDARELVWRMCCQNPHKRTSLHSVVRELERLAIKESSEHSQPELDPADVFHEYEYGRMEELWLKLHEYMEKWNDSQYYRALDKLAKIHKRLLESTHSTTLFGRFHVLLAEFYETVKMSPEHARMMRLSSTRATATSLYAFQWRIESLMASLGLNDHDDSTERHARWQEERSEQIELFVLGVSDTFILLQDLKSAEERSAFLRTLEAEMENPAGKYTSAQLEVMKHTFEEVAGKIETDDFSELTPEWFIPWYELVIDEWNCLGEGAFGGVYRAKWLDSDVVVKRVTLAGSDVRVGASTTIDSGWLASDDPSVSQAEEDASKRAEAVAMFRREVNIWFNLSHPHVVRLFGACHIGRPFFVCEYATNGTLISYLRQHPDELWSKLHEAALGVQYLHARDVVHGDLKGNNIVVGSDMKAKVTDFGLSSVSSEEDKALVSGAWNWVAPELLDTNERPTFASDVYSLGMCVVEALRVVEAVKSGKDSSPCLPWRVGDRAAVKYHATHGTLPARPTTSEDDQWELVRKMCVLDPEKRIKISTVVDELARLANLRTTSQAMELADISPPGAVSWEAVPDVIAVTQGLLNSLYCDVNEPGAMILQFISLWERIEQLRRQMDVNERDGIDRCCAAFCSLVAASHVSTRKLEAPRHVLSPRKGKKRAPAIDSKVTCETFETTDEASLAISETSIAASETSIATSETSQAISVSFRQFSGEFPSWAAFHEGLTEYQDETHQLYKIRSTNSVADRNKQRSATASRRGTSTNLFDESLKFYTKTLICTHGWTFKPRGKGSRTNHNIRSIQCSAKISAVLVKDGDNYKVRVSSHVATHNHDVSRDVYYSYAEARKITSPGTRNVVKTLVQGGSKKKKILRYLKEVSGNPVLPKDVENLIAKMRKETYTSEDDNERVGQVLRDFSEGPENAVNVFRDKKTGLTSCITFQTAHMRRMTRKFPEAICVDATYGTNINRYRLFSFMVTDKFGCGAFDQHALVDGESRLNMHCAVRAFKQNNPSWTNVKVIVIDKDFTELALLREEFPGAAVILCHFHVIDYLKREVSKKDYGFSAFEKMHIKNILTLMDHQVRAQKETLLTIIFLL